ncbi:hypothetical protein [Kitasatospora griseola]|uniref:hypothetical protein n=1 Tax=Kitasatospora griseola TaxID=2064 RepID=UPI00382901C1
MADETPEGGGTVLGFPALLVPGAVTEAVGTPTLAPLTTEFGPPASLSVPANPVISGAAEVASSAMEAAPAAGPGSLGQVAAMSSVMMAGITVTALRGAYHAVSYLKARAEHFKSVRDQQEATRGKANAELEKARLGVFAAQQKGRTQSGPEFGRTSKSSGLNSSQNSGRTNSMPPTGPKPGPPLKQSSNPGRKPDTGRNGGVDGRGGSGGSPGPGKVQDSRRRALEDAGRSHRPDRNSGSGNGSGNRPGKHDSAPKGPAPKAPKQLHGPDTMRGAARQRAANRIANGPTPKPPKTPKQLPGPDTIRGAARQRAADRITNGNWKPASAGQGGVRGPDTIRGAARTRLAGRILNGKKPKGAAQQAAPAPGTPAAATPTGSKASLVKQPKPAAGGTAGSASGATGSTGAGTAGAATGTAAGAATGGGRKRSGGRKSPYMKRANQAKKKVGRAKSKARSRAKSRMKKAGGRRHTGSKQTWWQRAATRRSHRSKKSTRRTTSTGSAGSTGSTGSTTGAQSAQSGFAPPPGWGHTQGPTTVYSRADRPGPHTAGAIGPGQAALPRAPYVTPHARPGTTGPGPTAPAPAPTAPTAGGPVTLPAPRPPAVPSAPGTAPRPHGTQYAESELTIGDVIEADADMAEEILQGADDALEAADACERFLGRLEALHAKIVDLKVPGSLEDRVLELIDRTGEVKARAEAIAAAIPAAAEAIEAAGNNAARRDKPVADIVREQGHIAPAEREYHDL